MSRLTRYKQESLLTDEGGYYEPETHYAAIVAKLGKLEDLEDDLGCPLDVVFKAFKEGFYFISDLFCKNVFTKQFIDRVLLYYSDELNCYCFSIGYSDSRICLKDYKKTWWLKEDLSE